MYERKSKNNIFGRVLVVSIIFAIFGCFTSQEKAHAIDIGYTEIGASTDTHPFYATCNAISPAHSGNIHSIHGYFSDIGSAPNNQWTAAIYEGSTPGPTGPVATSSAKTTLSSGWNTISGFDYPITEGELYWICIDQNSTSDKNKLHFDYDGLYLGTRSNYGITDITDWPTLGWLSPQSWAFSIYATYDQDLPSPTLPDQTYIAIATGSATANAISDICTVVFVFFMIIIAYFGFRMGFGLIVD